MKYRPAGLIMRAISFFIDQLVITALSLAFMTGLSLLSGIITLPAFLSLGCVGVYILISLIYYLYYQSHLGDGCTPGQKVCHLRVLNRDASSTPSPLQSVKRFLGGYLNLQTLGLTLFSFVMTRPRQSLSDLLSDTMVFVEIQNGDSKN